MYIVEEEKEHVADLTGRQLIVGIGIYGACTTYYYY